MSGGAYEYAYLRVLHFAESLRCGDSEPCPEGTHKDPWDYYDCDRCDRAQGPGEYGSAELRRKFREHLKLVAEAMLAVEWNDSGDGDPEEEQKIRAFGLLERWDAAAPTLPGVLAAHIGHGAVTEQVLGDLRVPVYCTDMVFVRSSPDGQSLMMAWHEESAHEDPRLGFLRALWRVKPRFLGLPSVWLGPASARVRYVQQERDSLGASPASEPRHPPQPLRRPDRSPPVRRRVLARP